jgi:hypothetical protein
MNMEKQQHPESAMGCQSQLTKGFCSDSQTQLFCPIVARLSFFTIRVDCVSGLPVVDGERDFRGTVQFDSQARILEMKPTKAVPQL